MSYSKLNMAFVQGAACAIASIIKGHGEDTSTREAMRDFGLHDAEAARKYGVDEYDIAILFAPKKHGSNPPEDQL